VLNDLMKKSRQNGSTERGIYTGLQVTGVIGLMRDNYFNRFTTIKTWHYDTAMRVARDFIFTDDCVAMWPWRNAW